MTVHSHTNQDAHGIPASLAGKPGGRFSDARRAVYPEASDGRHPRARELAERIAEFAGSDGGASEAELRGAGFTIGEIVEHLPVAKLILAESFVREVSPRGDRVPEIIEKALMAAAHRAPCTAGHCLTVNDEANWRRFCAARAAFKLDPLSNWSQGERTLYMLKAFLAGQPVLEREINRVVTAVAAAQKADASRGVR